MKKSIKRGLCMALIVSLFLALPLSASAATLLYKQGGRHDINIGAYANGRAFRISVDKDTRIIWYDSSYRELQSRSLPGFGNLLFNYNFYSVVKPSNAKYLSLHLDSNKRALVLD